MSAYVTAPTSPACGTTRVLISHSNALVCAGLVATMLQLGDCDVRCCAADGADDQVRRLDDADLVIADRASLARSMHDGSRRGPIAARPQIVLLSATTDEDPSGQALPEGVRVCLPLSCGPDDLLKTVCQLIGTTVRTTARPNSHAGGSTTALRPERPRGGIAPSALQRVRTHIEQHLCEHIDIAHLASMTGLSTCHFSRAFKQSLGVPPHRYVLTRRVLAAAAMIHATDRPMAEIALEVGFSDQSHFTRVFSAHMGESPRRFRYLHR